MDVQLIAWASYAQVLSRCQICDLLHHHLPRHPRRRRLLLHLHRPHHHPLVPLHLLQLSIARPNQ